MLVDIIKDNIFIESIRTAVGLSKIKQQEISDILYVSSPTIDLWMAGKNLPHKSIRKLILKALNREIEFISVVVEHKNGFQELDMLVKKEGFRVVKIMPQYKKGSWPLLYLLSRPI